MKNLDHSRILAARLFATALLLASAGSGLADVHYVDVNSANPTPPYTNWATATTNIQDAVDAAVAGDEILVTNGTYATGGRALAPLGPSRVAVDNILTLRSVNDPRGLEQARDSQPLGGDRVPCFTDQVVVPGASMLGLTIADDGSIYYADYFGGAIGAVDASRGVLTTILSGLDAPSAIGARGSQVFFTEAGTDAGQYHDGKLSVYSIVTGQREIIHSQLQYPVSLFIDAHGDIYVLEGAGSGTVFGGNNRLIRFPAGSRDYEVLIPFVEAPAAVVLDSQGTILIATFGNTIPGDTANLLAYRNLAAPEVLVTGLPAVWDMIIDEQDNLYLAGFGSDGGPMVGIALVQKGSSSFLPLKSGIQAWCLARDRVGKIFYSTGRSDQSIRVLTPCSTNHPPVAVATVSPLFAILPNETDMFILSPNNADATVVLDGSQSSDADNDPLQFLWYADGQPSALATGALATHQFAVGPHTLQLAVSDGHDTATAQVSFAVITPATAVGQLMAVLDEANLGSRNKQPLLATLSAAMSSFDRGDFKAGVNQLSAFQNQVRAQISPWNRALASEFTAASEKISDVMSGR